MRYTRTPGGATAAVEHRFSAADAESAEGDAWVSAAEESSLLQAEGQDHDEVRFLAGETTPVLFCAAVLNFGVQQLLETLVESAPPAEARADVAGRRRPVNTAFSGFVFKVQSGMNASHRDHVAFVRVCSGVFHRGMVVTHAANGRPFATKYAQQMFGQERRTADEAWPGDVVGLINAASLRVGDSLYDQDPVEFPPMPRLEALPYQIARRTDRVSAEILGHDRQVEVLLRSDGTLLALFSTPWRLRNTIRDHPELMLEDLATGSNAVPAGYN